MNVLSVGLQVGHWSPARLIGFDSISLVRFARGQGAKGTGMEPGPPGFYCV